VERWSKQYRQDEAAGRVAALERLIDWLPRHLPEHEQPAAIVHGDYRADNVIFHPTEPRVIAILDWETATIGDPLIDVGLSTALWPDASDGDLPFGQSLGQAALGEARLGSRTDLASHYARVTGRSIEHLPYYQALGLFKLAAILEGSWARHVHGAADDPFFALLEAGVPAMARRARALSGA